ncbi:hypothetical protein KBD81_00885, partial [Candidatus Woesebacteria bacterium]|nr:hypothetical protein [Candidatus Woesebacteria bacterium]
ILVVLALHEIQIHKKRLIFVLLSLLLIFEFSLFLRFFHGVYAEKSDQLFYAKARIIEKVAAKHWPESPLFYTTESLGEPQIYPLVGARYPALKYQQTRVAEFRDDWVFVTGAENLFYADAMTALIPQIEVNTQYPAYGILSSTDIASFPETICYDVLHTETIPLLQTIYHEVQLKKCTP